MMYNSVKRLVALYLGLVGLAVFFNLIFTPLYHDGSETYPVWEILDYFMAVGVVLALMVASFRKFVSGGDDHSKRAWDNIFCYAALAVTALFFWEWTWVLNPENETGLAVTAHVVLFPLVDVMVSLLCLEASRWIWKRSG